MKFERAARAAAKDPWSRCKAALEGPLGAHVKALMQAVQKADEAAKTSVEQARLSLALDVERVAQTIRSEVLHDVGRRRSK